MCNTQKRLPFLLKILQTGLMLVSVLLIYLDLNTIDFSRVLCFNETSKACRAYLLLPVFAVRSLAYSYSEKELDSARAAEESRSRNALLKFLCVCVQYV